MAIKAREGYMNLRKEEEAVGNFFNKKVPEEVKYVDCGKPNA